MDANNGMMLMEEAINVKNNISPEVEINDFDKNIFINAVDARKKTNMVHKKRIEVEMLPIYDVINKCINEGKFETDIIKLTNEQISFLQNKKFYCYKKQVSGNIYYVINWKL